MDQVKIGKFIAKCRKDKHLTQMQLAEKLNITDRAISKWENGKGMPDSSIMLDLCNELGINVNELLSGEKIEMEDYNEKLDKLLIEMKQKEEINNKKLFIAMYVIGILSVVSYLGIVFLVSYYMNDITIQTIICVIATFIFFLTIFYALKLEVDAGYYECSKCHHKFIPTYKEVLLSTHFGTTRHLRCPKCHQKSWSKKVLSK
jgi:transcriptional regulator with XRE-family HTH domain/DNA-directed RNA polymerase subunit RPC12/RpoP